MSIVTVTGGTFDNYAGDEVTLKLRRYLHKKIVASNGDIVLPGRVGNPNFYGAEISCTVANGAVSYPAFTLVSTVDAISNPKDARWDLALFTTAGKKVKTVAQGLRVPATPTPTTVAALNIYSGQGIAVVDDEAYTKDQIDAMIASLAAVSDTDARIPFVASRYATLTAAINAIGSTKARLIIDSNIVANAADVVPSNIIFESRAGAMVTKSGSGTITFQGFGLADPTSQVPIFSGFAAGNITWTGTDAPAEISTELWSTGNTSLSDRLARADLAFPSKRVKIIAYPRTITASTTFSRYRHLHFTMGNYPNTINSAICAFLFVSDFTATADRDAIINVALIGNMLFNPVDLTLPIDNIFFEGLYIKHDQSATPISSSSIIITGAAQTGHIRRCIFEDCLAYVVVGGTGTLGNWAKNFDVTGNKFINCATQALAVINGVNIQIRNNHFDARGIASTANNTQFDLEPNASYDHIENLIIDGNTFDLRAGSGLYTNGMAVQSTASNVKNVTISNNTIIGDANVGACLTGMRVDGIDGVRVFGNRIVDANQRGLGITNCNNVTAFGNDIYNSGDSAFSTYALHVEAVRNGIFSANNLWKELTGRGTGIYEAEEKHTVTTSGSTVTFTAVPYCHAFWDGLSFLLNATIYTVDAVAAYNSLTTTVAPGTLAVKTAASATDVDTGTDTITLGAHNFINGCLLRYTAGSVAIGGLTTGNDYYVVGRTGTTIQVALTLGGAAINLTSTGTGNQSFTPVLQTRFSNNLYTDNDASIISLESSGTSQIVRGLHDQKITNVADTAYTVLPADGIIVYTSLTAGRIVTLPTAVGCKGKEYVIKDGAGAAAANNITVDGNGSETIDGAANSVISTNYGKVRVKSNGTGWITI